MNEKTRNQESGLMDQEQAVGAYLEALLQPVSEADSATGTEQPVPQQLAIRSPAVLTPAVFAPAIIPSVPLPEPEIEDPDPVRSESEPVATAAGSGRPAWAEEPFQVLLFKVAGLQLAIPLVELNGVVPWLDEAVTEMPNHRGWFLGLRDHLQHRVKLIDIAAVILPPDRYASLAAADSSRLGKVVLINDYEWGLACEDVAEMITLEPDAVKWRPPGGDRRWLAGTVIEHMCALLNVDAFGDMLREEGLSGA